MNAFNITFIYATDDLLDGISNISLFLLNKTMLVVLLRNDVCASN